MPPSSDSLPPCPSGLPLSPKLKHALEQLKIKEGYTPIGRVERVVGLSIEVTGLTGRLGDVCYVEQDIYTPTGPQRTPLMCEVIGFKEGRLTLMPLEEMVGISPNARAWNTGEPFQVPVCDALVGRVLNGLGQPLDEKYPIRSAKQRPVMALPPNPLQRQSIGTILPLGVRAMDAFLTMGEGQRVGVFAGSGVGKSTLLGMLARNADADLSVIALIGERGREVKEFLEEALGEEGQRRSIVVVATAEQPALAKIKAGLVATTIAEHFRSQGKRVLLMMDSLTRVAMALREVGLAGGEPPATRGYPPSVFAFMPRLLERAGMDEQGSITGIYTVLVDGDDMNEPIADLVRGLLDGHIVLSRKLAQRNHFPAIDVGASVSRLFLTLASPTHKATASEARNALATYTQNEDLLSIGAYTPGQNPTLDKAVTLKPLLDAFLQQSVDEVSPLKATLQQLEALIQASSTPTAS
ncbi:MAG: FliI/YscN family ATPase [Vampirovibrionales bacterium]